MKANEVVNEVIIDVNYRVNELERWEESNSKDRYVLVDNKINKFLGEISIPVSLSFLRTLA